MHAVNFEQLVNGTNYSGWTFRKEYPSMLGTSVEGEEIWISDDQMRVAVGRQFVALKLFLWVCPRVVSVRGEGDEVVEQTVFECRLGMVPSKESLDDKALTLLNKLTRKKFHTNPYYHLVTQKSYREVFMEQSRVLPEDVVAVVENMKLAATHVERNMLEYLSGSKSREDSFTDGSEKVPQNGWSVLVRARTGSI